MANPIAKYVNCGRHNKAVEAFNGQNYPELSHLSPERLRELSGIRNANAHAYVSAMIERENFPGLAKSLGTAREWQSWLSDKWSGNDNTKDHLRDEWNNDVGRQIGRYAKERDLGEADVMGLVDYARRNGDLIRSISDKVPDPRLQSYSESSERPSWSGPPPRDLPPLEALHEKRDLQRMQANADNWQSKPPIQEEGFWSGLFPGRGTLKQMMKSWGE
ncbi:hypothetical protein PWG15_09805 [Ensifer adhaerens]|uniref:hypothetical protein n=1 Tax=Ensifer adhaerens TaxID=106592 RepID=UPI0023A9924F|nr:hypothetical protein [Ensifer adhaerens]WDZ78757.1 hypothetical protein PWG15_09805 [Ensifer adhaerens]